MERDEKKSLDWRISKFCAIVSCAELAKKALMGADKEKHALIMSALGRRVFECIYGETP